MVPKCEQSGASSFDQCDQVSSTYRFISWDHGDSLTPKTPFRHCHIRLLDAKNTKRGTSLLNCGVSCVQPTSCCPTLSLILQPTGGASRVEAGADRGTEPGYRGGGGSSSIQGPLSAVNREDGGKGRGEAINRTHRSGRCDAEARKVTYAIGGSSLDYCTERLYNGEVRCCAAEQHMKHVPL